MSRVSNAIFPMRSSFVLNVSYNQTRQIWLVVLMNLKTKQELEFDSLEDMKLYLEQQTKPKGLR
jgi:hypothetical protein